METVGSTQHEEQVWERIFSRDNLFAALARVKENRGAPGIDGMTVEELPDHLRAHWEGIRAKLERGTYRPSPVKRVAIPKPGGGERLLGIPTVLDRLIQQAIARCSARCSSQLQRDSYGFRPDAMPTSGRSRTGYIEAGYGWVVDIDLERFFDTVNHDRLMARINSLCRTNGP
jgi:retron-type reverse transcriptase